MEGSPGPSDLRKQLKQREAEVGVLRDRLRESLEEIDRLRRENEELRKELKAAGRGKKSQGQSKRKKRRKRSGRKAGKGPFTFRGAPAAAATSEPPQPVPVTITQCPCCGGDLRYERTDDTGWRIHGQAAFLMAFDTDQATVFQIRDQHRNEEVRELVPANYSGVMVTDRGPSYDAEELSNLDQQKCLDHLKRNIDEVLET